MIKRELLKKVKHKKVLNINIKEEELYGSIGEWLRDNKGCQQDDYSQGCLFNIEIIKGFKPDVIAIRYEPIERPAIRFHGFIVEVKRAKYNINEMVGKLLRLKEIKQDIYGGIHTLKLYIAYPTDKVDEEIFRMCEKNEIGILRLDIIDKSKINIYEVLKPIQIELNGIPNNSMQSPGIFENSINYINGLINGKKSYLGQFFQRPSKLYNGFIRPVLEKKRKSYRRD